ncbi:unnamed protein product [Arabidopsis halleri]
MILLSSLFDLFLTVLNHQIIHKVRKKSIFFSAYTVI